jgi:hypothetical protein
MGFESVRGYIDLASGLGELTRARALEAAQGLLSLPATSIATGTKVAGQAGALAEELLVTATANRSNLTELVRSEVAVAVTRLGLVPAQKLEEAQAESTRLRAEIARLRSIPAQTFAPKSPAKKSAAPRSSAKKAATARRSAVTTRAKPSGK